MKRSPFPLLFGSLLVLAGVVYLLQNFNILQIRLSSWMWVGLFAISGGLFVSYWVSHRDQWWAIIPAGALLGLCATVLYDLFSPLRNDWGGAIFLGSIGFSFLLVFAVRRAMWWAIIPGGVLITLAAIVVAQSVVGTAAAGGLLFVGIGLTFVLVALLPGGPTNPGTRWAWIPAGILIALGLFSVVGALNLFNWLWPLALIVLGGVLLWRTLRRSNP